MKAKSGKWYSAQVKPQVEHKFSESDYLLCLESSSSTVPFVAWYNKKMDSWYVAHHLAPTIPTQVSWWRLLPKIPKNLK